MMSVRGRRGIVHVKVIARFIRVSFLRAFMRVVFPPSPPLMSTAFKSTEPKVIFCAQRILAVFFTRIRLSMVSVMLILRFRVRLEAFFLENNNNEAKIDVFHCDT